MPEVTVIDRDMQEGGLVAVEPATALAVLTDQERFDAFYEKVKAETDRHVPDVTTDKGRKAIAALAFKVTKTKTAIDAAGKALTEEWRQKTAQVDASRKAIRDKLDALRDEVRAPLTEWEAAEEQRLVESKRQMWDLASAAVVTLDDTVETVEARLLEVRGRNLDASLFGVEIDLAQQRRDQTVATLTAALDRLRKERADQEELARLRQAQAEADARERARVAQEAADREAEEARQREAAAAERLVAEKAEARRLEAERQAQAARDAEAAAVRAAEDAAAKAAHDADERAVAEQRVRDEAHAAELAAERARADEAEAARAAEAKKREDEQRARDEETRRQQEEADEQRRADEARTADIAHRSGIMRAAKEALIEHCVLEEDVAKDVVRAITSGLIPAVAIRF